MTYYLGKVGRAGARLVSSCKDLYNDVNAAYLTGASDVVVVKQKDGTLKSTPFHVRFGKLGVLRTGDLKEVEIEVNGSPVDLTMYIDETGKIFWYNRAREDPDPGKREASGKKEASAAVPIPGACDLSCDNQVTSTSTEEPLSQPTAVAIDIETISSDELMSSSLPYNLEVLSDSAVETSNDRVDGEESDSARITALSDTEVEVSDRRSSSYWDHKKVSRRTEHDTKGDASPDAGTTSPTVEELRERLKPHEVMPPSSADRSGFWNALTRILKRRHSQRFSSAVEDGIYLDDIDYESMDPEELAKFFPNSSSSGADGAGSSSVDPPAGGPFLEPAGSSGIGSSPTFSISPAHSLYDLQRETAIRESMNHLISTLDDVGFSLCGGLAQDSVTADSFQNSYVSFSEFCKDPVSLLANPNLVVRVDGKYYSWQLAAPLLMSAVVFLQVLPQKTHTKITNKYMPKKSRQSFWNFWGRGQKEEERAKSEGATPEGSPQKWRPQEEREKGGVSRKREVSSDEDGEVPSEVATRPRQRSLKRNKKLGFTNVLTSQQLESLHLLPGPNKVVFSITTKYQGTAKATCTVYVWNYNDKIVVSDIDGTITRSDVAGQVLPLLGMDWTQNGVVELFTAISKNGYNIVYLSARAIGQAGYTKEFLRKVRRGAHCLPDGPLFLFPFSLYTAFRKEVIEKRPEEFKIHCLMQIQALFPKEFNPMHAGFGNRHNDVKSYLKVGIPQSRIFTVNHKGIIKYELSFTFQSSYSSLKEMVDTQFPPLRCRLPSLSLDVCQDQDHESQEEFSTFNYWRTPVDYELPFDLPDLT